MESKSLVDRLLSSGVDVRTAIKEDAEIMEGGYSLLPIAKWLLGHCDADVVSNQPKDVQISQLIDALRKTPELLKDYLQNAIETKPVYESVNSDDFRVGIFLQAVENFIKAYTAIMDSYEELEDAYPDFPDIFAEDYPFERSFDEYGWKLNDWRDAMKDKLLG